MALAATAILAASCTKEVMTKDEFFEGLYEKCTIEADATLPGTDSIADADKAYVDGSTRKVIWQSGDQLRINGTDLTVAEIDSGGVRAKFYGTVGALPDGSNYRYWAVYPKTLATAQTMNGNSTLTINLPATQTVNTSNLNYPLAGYSYMAGHAVVPQTASRVHFQMRNVGTLLKLTLKANTNDFRQRVDKIVLTSSANLTGAFTIPNTLSSNPNFTINSSSGSTSLTVNFSGGSLDISSQKTIYVFLPPLSGKSLNMKIYGGYGLVSYVEKNVSSITLERNKIYEYSNTNISFDKVFSVASNRKVIFSPGNLQWSRTKGTANNTSHTTVDGTGTAGTWRFAENQWNFVGANYDGTVYGNVYGVGGVSGTRCDNSNIASDYKGWIDLFGWGTSGYNSKQPYKVSISNTGYGDGDNDIDGTYYDWGRFNAIYNPKTGEIYGTNNWRTLTYSEWKYLLNPDGASSGARTGNRFAKAIVNNVKGLVIFPDGAGANSFTKINKTNASFSDNTRTDDQWKTLEQNGFVFLPACGYRYRKGNATEVKRVVPGTTVYYWTSSKYNASCARHVRCEDGILEFSTGSTNDGMGRAEGFAVRLVRTHP